MNKIGIIILSIILFFIASNDKSYSWTVDTHANLSEYAAKESVLSNSKGNYLRHIGFVGGLDEEIKWLETKTVNMWLAEGAEQEDAGNKLDTIMGIARFYNHFHDPIESWDSWSSAGLDDYLNILIPPAVVAIPYHVTGKSLLLWAQDDNNQNGFVEGDWTWKKIRDYYYDALTLTLESQRQEYFARMFRGLGHQMHLVQDAAQPDHVRNDAHPLDSTGSGFEEWTRKNPYYIVSLAATANSYLPDIPFNISYNSLVPVSQLIDAEQYDGSAPSASLAQGIAEYTNANFFSDDTVFAAERFTSGNRHYFPYPKRTSTDMQLFIDGTKPPETIIASDGVQDTGVWISKDKDGEDDVPHFVRARYLSRTIYNFFGEGELFYRSFYRDEECHKDYAKKLIPRAVGYSSGLLNYFFRGEIDLIKDTATGSGYVIVNNTDEDMNGTFELYYDDTDDNLRKLHWTGTFAIEKSSSGNNKSGNIDITFPSNASEIILVFKGTLDNETDTVAGKVLDKIYLIVMPFDHVTRQLTGKNYYSYKGYLNNSNLTAVTENDLPFSLVDDGGYWNAATSDWTDTQYADSVKAPLGVGGPQNIAKYRDEANNRVRFVPNASYEKNAYQRFDQTYMLFGQEVKAFSYVIFEGTPLLSYGKYEENPGYMEYVEDPVNPGTYGLYSLRSVPVVDPMQAFFSAYFSLNFVGTFLEYDKAIFYRFDGTKDERGVPKDADAQYASVVSVSPSGSGFDVKVPGIFNYTRPNPYWGGSAGYGSSGVYNYTAQIGAVMVEGDPESDAKCSVEDNNCGNTVTSGEASSVMTVFDVPYNFNSYVTVHINDGGEYFEELFINGQLMDSSTVSINKLETHYQILAVYKDTAVVRETNWNSSAETPLDDYMYKQILADDGSTINPQIYEVSHNFTAKYAIYVNGARYALTDETSVKSKILDYPYHAGFDDNVSLSNEAEYLTFEYVEDITGYHLDRIFISDTFDGNYILVAFDEYSYNGGDGIVHALQYQESDIGDDKFFLYYDIPEPDDRLQRASHEALPVGRKLLLFNANGTLEQSLEDPVTLDYSIGSIGILN